VIKMYHTDIATNKTEETKEYQKGNWINMIAPTEEEIKKVCKKLNIQEDFIRYSLDYEEKARIDIEEDDNTLLFIIDVPIIEKENKEPIYSTMPLGMIVVRDDYFITVSLKSNRVIAELEKTKTLSHIKKVESFYKYFIKMQNYI